MPVYNRHDEFREAIQSVCDQDYEDLEIIIIDDGSSPAIEPIQCTDRVIKHIRQENRGAARTRNRGFENSAGIYIIFWDADIVAPHNMLTSMHDMLETNTKAGYAYCDFQLENGKSMRTGAFDPLGLRKQNYIHTTSLIRRSVFSGFDEQIQRFQDWDLWLSLLEDEVHGVYVPTVSFSIISKGTLSNWLPRYAYWFPFKYAPFFAKKVHAYERARERILEKHNLI